MQFAGMASPNGMSLAEVIGGTEDDLRTFIATHFGRSYGVSTNKTTITITQLPQDGILSELTLPASIRVIGTVFRSALNSHELLFTTQTPDAAFKSALIDGIKSDGWQEIPASDTFRQGGFTAQSAFSTLLCHPQKQMRLALSLEDNGLGSLSIHAQRNPCEDPHRVHMGLMAQLPTLTLPPNLVTTYQQGSGGGSDNHVHSSASILTDASLAHLFEHYQSQLSAHSWILSKHHALDDLSLSYWDVSIDGETWRGKLIITAVPDTQHIELWLELRAPIS